MTVAGSSSAVNWGLRGSQRSVRAALALAIGGRSCAYAPALPCRAVGAGVARTESRVGRLSLTMSGVIVGLVGIVAVGAAPAPRLLTVNDLPPGFSRVGQVLVSTPVSGSLVDSATCQVREQLDQTALDAYTIRFSRPNSGQSNSLVETVVEYPDVVSAKKAFEALVDQSRVLERCRRATLVSQAPPSVFESTTARFPRVGDVSFAARVLFVSTAQGVLDVTFRSQKSVVVMAFADTGANVVSPKDETRIAKRAASLFARSH
jgi:hypothetical protein